VASLANIARRLELLELQAPKKPKFDAGETARRMRRAWVQWKWNQRRCKRMSVPDKITANRQELEQLRDTAPDEHNTLWGARFLAYRVSTVEADIAELEGASPRVVTNLRRAAVSLVSGRRDDADDLETDRQGASETAADYEALEGGQLEPDNFEPAQPKSNPARKIMRVIEQDRLASYRDDDARRRWEPDRP
jgi:hypothetical protein